MRYSITEVVLPRCAGISDLPKAISKALREVEEKAAAEDVMVTWESASTVREGYYYQRFECNSNAGELFMVNVGTSSRSLRAGTM